MARGKLWSVKGISPEAREAARMAAQESGAPIGAWIDQAIRMSDEELSGSKPDAAPSEDDATALEIVRVLEALEARVASHADHIARQLEPVRESIAELDRRLARIEGDDKPVAIAPPDVAPAPEATDAVQDDDAPLDFMPHPPQPTDDEAYEAGNPDRDAPHSETSADGTPNSDENGIQASVIPSPDGPDAEEPSANDPAPEDATDSARNIAATAAREAPPPDTTSFEPEPPTEPRQHEDAELYPREVSEEDIHAADATLKSDLNGLFDDGAHQAQQFQVERPGYDPRFPPPPPRRRSRAPLIFISVVLLAACVGMGAFVWFQLKAPGASTSISFDNIVAKLEAFFTPDGFAPDQSTAPNTGTGSTSGQPGSEQPGRDQSANAAAESAAPPTPPAATGANSTDTTPAPSVDQSAGTPSAPVSSATVDSPEITRLISEAAAGDAKAQNELGNRYLVGRGVTQDYAEAARWLQGAAAKGVTAAQYNLGVLYDSGRGVEADPTQALFWFHNAAEKGHGRAQMAMAAAYAAGRGIERNPDEALKWLRAASESNISDAQISLANILASSPENRSSLIDAVFWYRVADANGVGDAADRGDQVAKQLTAEERAGVNRRVSHFLAQKLSQPRTPSASTTQDTPASATPASETAPQPQPEPQPAPNSTAPSAVTPPPPPPPAPPQPETGSTGTGSTGTARVQEIQTLLGRLGFDAGPADGTMGTKTREAIRAYQKELSLPVDGEPSAELLSHLRKIIGLE